ncbi:MAG: hypothetical protein ABR961_03235 [Thermoanaerobaculaceae bacterium]|jgi:hypothetical protein
MPGKPEPQAEDIQTTSFDSPEDRRHKALLRMLGHVKDAIRLDPRVIYRAAALAGYNANPDPNVGNADPDAKARWADEDAESLLAIGSDEQT